MPSYSKLYLFCYIQYDIDILPPRPQELEATKITENGFTVKWTTSTLDGSQDAAALYQVFCSKIMHSIWGLKTKTIISNHVIKGSQVNVTMRFIAGTA